MCPVSDDDWRLQGQESFLQGASLKLMPWRSKNPTWDHDHCEFCQTKLAGPEIADALHEGYGSEDLYRWVCSKCFEDFRERFQFKVIP